MSSKSVFKSLNKILPQNLASNPNQELAWKISMALTSSSLKSFETNNSLLFDLNNGVTNLVLSNPRVPIHRRLDFFKFLGRNEHFASKPDLRAHLTLARCLFESRRFAQMKILLNSVIVDNDLRCPVSNMVDLIEDDIGEGKSEFVSKFCDMLFRVYASNGMFEEAFRVFDFTEKIKVTIEERSCFEVLVALKKSKMVDSCLGLFSRMIQRRIEITVYSLTVAVDCLCRNGDVERAKVLVNDLASREIVKPNAFTYNLVLKSCIEMKDFDSVNEVLSLMEKNNVGYNQVTFTLLIDWHGGCGRFEDARKLFDEMRESSLKPDAYVYTSMIKWSCRNGDFKSAISFFDELDPPGAHAYGALVNGLCKAGQIEAAEILVNEMDGPRGIGSNRVVLNTLMDGYCRIGSIDKAMKLKGVMEKKGLEMDVFCYNSIASGLCRLNRSDEAKRLLFAMAERGIAWNFVSYTALVDIHCKEGDFVEANRIICEMKEKGEKPNVVTYNALVDGYCKRGKMKEAHAIKVMMGSNGVGPDSYTYTSLIHGECIAGNLDYALTLFDEMSTKGLTRNVVTYTAMISGLSTEGRSEEAFKLYDEMKKAGLKPDDRVYTSLVSSLHSNKS